MIKKILVSVLITILLISSVSALDLKNFPQMFIKNDQIDAIIVVGRSAKAEDVLGSVDVSVMLQNEVNVKQATMAKLDNEVGSLSAYNSIVIGGPCANSAAAKLLDYPKNCLEGYDVGKGYIKLFEWSNGNIAMLVAGTTAIDTRRTTHILANYDEYNLTGTSLVVSGVSMNDLTVKNV